MCGLLTFVSARGAAALHRDAVAAALEAIHHRGPDETAVTVVGDSMVFGYKRLSVIDVSHSHQPLVYPADGFDAGRYMIAFDGEIYNYIELRDELITEYGATFATDGDAEVIVAAYRQWGEQAVTRLRGMFAIVIYDTHRRTVWGARDPYGIKPLFHLVTEQGIYFASEKKALLPFLPESRHAAAGAVDTANLSHYLTLQYVPEPGSLHRGIGRVGSGESFSYLPGGTFATRRYYQPVFRPTPVDEPDHLYREVLEALRESVRVHMRSDVPVGAFLLNGIDSTAIVALAREVNPEIMTFSAGYDIDGPTEIDVAQDTAQHLGVRNMSTRIGPFDMMAALPKIIWHLDDPLADPAVVSLYFAAKKAAEHVTVVLSGEGADELFGGYTVYRDPLRLSGVAGLPDPLQRGLRKIAHALPEGRKGKDFLERGLTPIEQRYFGNGRMFTEDEKRVLLRHYDEAVRYTDVTGPVYTEATAAGLDDVTKMQYIDLFTWLRGDILVKADRMSMAHSLELRTPFLDRVVFDVAARIPVELKVPAKSDATKYAMRRAVESILPPALMARKPARFPVPIRAWLRTEMYEWAHDILSRSGAGELVDLAYARTLLDEHKRGDRDLSRRIWTVLVFCVWHAIFIEGTLDPGIGRNPSALLTKMPVGWQ